MQVLVAGRGLRLERSEIVRAVRFYGRELLSKEKYDETKVYIDLFQKSQVNGLAGGIVLPFCNEPIGLVHVRLRTTQSRRNQLVTLAHEMVHLAQIVSGKFGKVRTKRGETALMWNRIVVSKIFGDLESMPWEREANDLECILYEKYEQTRV